jgi:hypothetical protein
LPLSARGASPRARVSGLHGGAGLASQAPSSWGRPASSWAVLPPSPNLTTPPPAAAAGPQARPTTSTSPGSAGAQHLQDLQIEQLEEQTSWEGRIRAYVPWLSVVAAAAGAAFAVWRYFQDVARESIHRAEDLAFRIEQEIAGSLTHVVEYAKADNRLNARVTSALGTLSSLVKLTDDPTSHADQITRAIISAVKDDIDFDDAKQVGFDAICLDGWPAYVEHLRAHPKEQQYILSRYRQAMAKLRKTNPTFGKLRYESGAFLVPDSRDYIEEPLYRHFRDLVDGFDLHRQVITSRDAQAQAVADFGAALRNPVLVRQLFGQE